jgi:hypothetical protein
MLSDLENHAEESRKIIIGILRGVEKEWLSIRCEEKKRKRRRKLKVQ